MFFVSSDFCGDIILGIFLRKEEKEEAKGNFPVKQTVGIKGEEGVGHTFAE